jgi:hypothetical protein
MGKIREFFISSNTYWDLWFKKLFAQFISVKIWCLAISVVLLAVGLITNAQFVTIFVTILGVKGFFDITDNIFSKKENGSEGAEDAETITKILRR